jgi:hypothetical protein
MSRFGVKNEGSDIVEHNALGADFFAFLLKNPKLDSTIDK